VKRRSFLKSATAVAAGAALGYRPFFAAANDPTRTLIPHASGLPRRVLGRTKREISIVGYPGLALSKIRGGEKFPAGDRRRS